MRRPITVAVVLLSIALGTSCRSKGSDGGGSSGGPDAGAFDKVALLRAFGECSAANYREFAAAAAELASAAAKSDAGATPAARAAARAAWNKAMDIWQRAEVFQFGPAAMTSSPGGADLRAPIYAWPLFARCLADQTIVSKTYEAPEFGTSLVSMKTLAAAEYLLFYEGADNGCPPTASINAQGQWAALGAPEIAKRRAGYARAVTADVATRAAQLADMWDPAKGNFAAELAGAGQSSKAFTTQKMAFNAVSDAMFYVDAQLKNLKVGKPAGLTPDCAAGPCVENVESPWAKRSKEHIRANLTGYEQLLNGCGAGGQGLGFDDLLIAVGAEPVAKKLATTTLGIRAALDALKQPTFEEDIQKDAPGVLRLFDSMRANGSAMKTEFVTVLDLEIPKAVEGDND